MENSAFKTLIASAGETFVRPKAPLPDDGAASLASGEEKAKRKKRRRPRPQDDESEANNGQPSAS